MGQAFDRDGNVLGEAFGDTKREVFDKLMKEHEAADEIRIRSFYQSGEEDSHSGVGASAEMPHYQSHKQVWALKIAAIDYDADRARVDGNRETDGSAYITPADPRYATFKVDMTYVRKHQPKVGGYYVVYKDGYKSFSPAEAFEEGYTRIS